MNGSANVHVTEMTASTRSDNGWRAAKQGETACRPPARQEL